MNYLLVRNQIIDELQAVPVFNAQDEVPTNAPEEYIVTKNFDSFNANCAFHDAKARFIDMVTFVHEDLRNTYDEIAVFQTTVSGVDLNDVHEYNDLFQQYKNGNKDFHKFMKSFVTLFGEFALTGITFTIEHSTGRHYVTIRRDGHMIVTYEEKHSFAAPLYPLNQLEQTDIVYDIVDIVNEFIDENRAFDEFMESLQSHQRHL